ncbi:MAG: hypothetical protein Q9164_004648, partial [Protoblastenia rupestris]
MASIGRLCTALNVSDQQRCEESATSLNGLFCSFHSKQCQAYLAHNPKVLANQTFTDIESEDILHDVYDYLALKHALLDRVIRARKLHHSRFFSLKLDYGHQHYLDTLSSQKYIVLRALERLERRAAEVLYDKRKWFKWVRECQDTEEAHRDNEEKKVKQEAALVKRHQKELQVHLQELKAKEHARRQDAELDRAYHERLSQSEQEEKEAHWDPIEDVMEDERATYIDLIKHFLFIEEEPSVRENGLTEGERHAEATAPKEEAVSKSKKSKKKTPRDPSKDVFDKPSHETLSQIRQRLKEGMKISYSGGMHISGNIDNPLELREKTAPLLDDESDKILDDVTEIKLLLFCRLLLSHATILPAALKANSIDEFLANKEVTDADLRDLCLKLDNPGLQEIRDACADLGRGEKEDEDGEDEDEEVDTDSEEEAVSKTIDGLKKYKLYRRPRRKIPEIWSSDREKRIAQRKHMPQAFMEDLVDQDTGNTLIDFGEVDDGGNFKSRKIRIKLCGKYIYNYPSEKAISRGGWLHYCVIAKDSDLHKAIQLCRNWDEFWELNILSIFQYFPAANWLVWKGDRLRQQLLQL